MINNYFLYFYRVFNRMHTLLHCRSCRNSAVLLCAVHAKDFVRKQKKFARVVESIATINAGNLSVAIRATIAGTKLNDRVFVARACVAWALLWKVEIR